MVAESRQKRPSNYYRLNYRAHDILQELLIVLIIRQIERWTKFIKEKHNNVVVEVIILNQHRSDLDSCVFDMCACNYSNMF